MSSRRRRYFGPKGTLPGKGQINMLPSILTTVSLFSGFYAIVAAINHQFFHAAVAIIIAGVFDGLDGRVARLTGTASRFGEEYDSLCDLVSFGVAPAILAYQWVLFSYGRYGWLAAFLYVAATALRLARFNSQSPGDGSKNFTGLPCPAAGGMIATSYLFCHFFEIGGRVMEIMVMVAVYPLSYLMVSSITYQSFKHPETQRKKVFQMMVGLVVLIMVLATEPRVTLFLLALIYVLSGPLAAAYRLLAPAKKVVASEPEQTAQDGSAPSEPAGPEPEPKVEVDISPVTDNRTQQEK
ncbi:MAG TPA: CDP-diacylglycerol--serine O-phosphatidyltransferase [Desulfurivibrio alkaliphilus]|uniref:CDP-diacylglycerol--serine O-phosphatidyltransferase n=1 Tax=Desulfurivibrio alkaliphilus TaxID=427923 RepID=A0A7C2XP77_9BACT|nr:CDP-diacylglycerol--serine O-phosphatidyltransferase [Desulfurivibrio alkaliphilus]